MRELLEPHAEELVAKVVEMAKNGDTTALRICIDRLIPPMKARDEAVSARLSGSLGEQGRSVLDSLAAGTVTPDQAATMLTAIATQARIVEVDEIERRVTALERSTNGAKA